MSYPTATYGFLRRSVCAPLVVLIACLTPPDEPDLGSGTEALQAANGIQLNGIQLNGIQFNGIQLNGIQLNGIQLNGIQLNGIQLNGTKLGGYSGSTWKEGTQLAGATLVGSLSSGATLPLRIDSVAALPAPDQDVFAHRVSYWNGAAWASMCGVDAAGAPRTAIPLAGTWSLGQGVPGGGAWTATAGAFTFACRGAALAKCVELGYKPWASRNGVSLRNHHQACTRMVRADYCGDGRPGTLDGWRVDVFDNLGIQAPTSGLGWSFEARWSANGAVCMSSTRALDLIVSAELPACVATRVTATCDATDFAGGVLVKNYFNPWGLNVVLQDAYASYPASRDDLQGAMDRIQLALDFLAMSPPRPRDAAGKIEQAVTKLKSALTKDLPLTFGNSLMRRYALLVRSSLVHEIAKTQAANPTASGLTCARDNLATGDVLLAEQSYPHATNRFKNGIGCL